MASEIIPTRIAAKILGMSRQHLCDEMASGRLDIGWVKPRGKKLSSHGTFRVYRAKLARHLGYEPDHIWKEETEGES